MSIMIVNLLKLVYINLNNLLHSTKGEEYKNLTGNFI
jgi:hypothetical protein